MLLEIAAATMCSAPIKRMQTNQIFSMEVMLIAEKWAEEDEKRGVQMRFIRDDNGRLTPVLRKLPNGAR